MYFCTRNTTAVKLYIILLFSLLSPALPARCGGGAGCMGDVFCTGGRGSAACGQATARVAMRGRLLPAVATGSIQIINNGHRSPCEGGFAAAESGYGGHGTC